MKILLFSLFSITFLKNHSNHLKCSRGIKDKSNTGLMYLIPNEFNYFEAKYRIS